jgi:hypothetical protein
MREKLVVLAAGAAMLLVAVPAWAHHAFAAEFDAKRPVKLRGKITRLEWINPHSWIHIEVIQDGKPVAWMIEGGSPNSMFRRGFTQQSLAVGTEIIVDGYQAKDGANRAVGSDLTYAADGRRLFMGSSSPDSPDAKRKE